LSEKYRREIAQAKRLVAKFDGLHQWQYAWNWLPQYLPGTSESLDDMIRFTLSRMEADVNKTQAIRGRRA
jgi:hypothetical protein